ncbi:MAG: glycosyl transferase family 2 protein [Parcubacteria group bacterium Gr01-1014_13]|nr:MAG: glycosyl transferase family 2 protein [Parcubacteria group bacterium Gr01-1014_13]
MSDKKLISVVTPCYNEELNVEELYSQVKAVFADLPQYRYEHIFIDNASTDSTVAVLKKLATVDYNVKIIVNIKNFGHIRSPYYGLQQAHGDAVVLMASDLQDPPATIKEFLQKWEEGSSIVVGVKNKSEENAIMFAIRKVYYNLIKKISDVEQIKNFTGFGLYDQKFIAVLRTLKDPYPYFRGLITELGFNRAEVSYFQPARKRGKTSNNFYSLYDLAMLGFVNHSKIPLRLASFIGFGMSVISFIVGIVYLIYKLLFWDRFEAGLAPLSIGIFFFSSIQLFFIGILGEYIGAIYTQVRERPLVIERERVNF